MHIKIAYVDMYACCRFIYYYNTVIGVMSLWCFIMSNTIKSKATTPVTNHCNTFGPNYPSNKPTYHMTKKPTKQLITEKRAQAPVQKIFFIMRKNTESRQLLLDNKKHRLKHRTKQTLIYLTKY